MNVIFFSRRRDSLSFPAETQSLLCALAVILKKRKRVFTDVSPVFVIMGFINKLPGSLNKQSWQALCPRLKKSTYKELLVFLVRHSFVVL